MKRGRKDTGRGQRGRWSRPSERLEPFQALVKKEYQDYYPLAQKHLSGKWEELYRQLKANTGKIEERLDSDPQFREVFFSTYPLLASVLSRGVPSVALHAIALGRFDQVSSGVMAEILRSEQHREKLISYLQTTELADRLDQHFNLFSGRGYSLGGTSLVGTASYALLSFLQKRGEQLSPHDFVAALSRRDLEILKLLLPLSKGVSLTDPELEKEVLHALVCYIPYRIPQLEFVMSNYDFGTKIRTEVCRRLLKTSPLLNPTIIESKESLLEMIFKSYKITQEELRAAIEGEDLFWVERLSRHLLDSTIEPINDSILTILHRSSPTFSALELFQIIDQRPVRIICHPNILLSSVSHRGLTAYLLEEHQELKYPELIWESLMRTTKVSTKSISCDAAGYLLKVQKFSTAELMSVLVSASDEGREDLIELIKSHMSEHK